MIALLVCGVPMGKTHEQLARRAVPVPAAEPAESEVIPSAPAAVAAPVVPGRVVVGSASDPSEAHADAVAHRAVLALRGVAVPRFGLSSGAGGGAGVVHRSGDPGSHGPIGHAGGVADASDTDALARLRGGGAPLPADLRRTMESAMGADLGAVRVHTGSAAAGLNDRFGAKAFTIGHDVVFRDGVPDTSTVDGQFLLAHELAHTAQRHQSAARRVTVEPSGAGPSRSVTRADEVVRRGGAMSMLCGPVEDKNWEPEESTDQLLIHCGQAPIDADLLVSKAKERCKLSEGAVIRAQGLLGTTYKAPTRFILALPAGKLNAETTEFKPSKQIEGLWGAKNMPQAFIFAAPRGLIYRSGKSGEIGIPEDIPNASMVARFVFKEAGPGELTREARYKRVHPPVPDPGPGLGPIQTPATADDGEDDAPPTGE